MTSVGMELTLREYSFGASLLRHMGLTLYSGIAGGKRWGIAKVMNDLIIEADVIQSLIGCQTDRGQSWQWWRVSAQAISNDKFGVINMLWML